MFSRKRLVTIGLSVGILGLFILFPARVAYHWFAPPQMMLSGISGTVWDGAAREATVDGFYLRDLDWRFRPLALLTGKLGFVVETKLASGFVEGELALGIGTIRARNLKAQLPLQSIDAVAAFGASGSLSADLAEIKVVDGLPAVADGTLQVAGLTLPYVQREPLGGFRAEMFTGDSGITASVEDTAAVLDFAGSLQLAFDGAYEFNAQIGPTDRTSPQLREQLRFVGPQNDRGQYEIRQNGRL